jgi:multidrug efflux pump subunit AcrA (membrane-fusion protein)
LGGGIVALILAVLAVRAVGRGQKPESKSSISSVPDVRVVKPERRNLATKVEQPGFVQAFEETKIYAMVSGFIKQYYVDIGQRVKKGDLLVDIDVPDLSEDHQQKVAQVELDRRLVEQAQQLVVVAESKLETAIAQLAEAKANVDRYQADIVFRESEVGRLTKMVEQHVVAEEDLDETQKQLSASRSARDAALAAVAARKAAQASAQADVGKAEIDVKTAKAQVKVAEADERRTAALLAYAKVTAPYDGVITVRNANTGDYVQAAAGDKTVARGSPLFVIARDDRVRVFVDVPEAYARYVCAGTKATVRAVALSGLEIETAIVRTSWSLTEKTRTLSAEIDLPTRNTDTPPKGVDLLAKNDDPPAKNVDPPATSNDPPAENGAPPAKEDVLRPGNYVYAQVIVERQGVWMLPQAALLVTGNETYCYLLQNGKAVKTAIVPGLSDRGWVEVTKMKINGLWAKVSGDEDVILGALDELTNGETVNVVQKQAP